MVGTWTGPEGSRSGMQKNREVMNSCRARHQGLGWDFLEDKGNSVERTWRYKQRYQKRPDWGWGRDGVRRLGFQVF